MVKMYYMNKKTDRGAVYISIRRAIVWKTAFGRKDKPPKKRDDSKSGFWDAAEDAADCHSKWSTISV